MPWFLLAAAAVGCSTVNSPAGTPPSHSLSATTDPGIASPAATPLASVREAARTERSGHDFNGDGYADLAIGVSEGAVNGKEKAGRVEVAYGAAGGVATGTRKITSRGAAAVMGEGFGATLASGDFDRDGYADLVIGAPGKGGRAGDVAIAFGARAGLADKIVTLEKPQQTIGFGAALAVGDFNRDGYHDLAVATFNSVRVTYGGNGMRAGGASWKTVMRDTAAVAALATGDVTGDGFTDLAVVYSEDDPADEGTGVVYQGSRAGLADRVGGTFPGWGVGVVAIGDLDGDGYGDVVAGNGYSDAEDPGGQIYVSRGSAGGLEATHTLWTQSSPGMPKAPDGTDGFGGDVAAGDVNGDGYADVAVGAGGVTGAAFVLYGGRGGLSTKGAQMIDAKLGGGAGEPVQGFGRDVALTDLDGDARAELVVSTGGEVTVLSPGRKDGATSLMPERPDENFGHPLN